MAFTDVLALAALIFFCIAFNIGQWRHLSRLKRNNQPHKLVSEDFILDEHFAKEAMENQMPDKVTSFIKEVLAVGFQHMTYFDYIEEYVVKKLEEREGGKWMCLIHVHNKVFRLSFPAKKELYMKIEKDELKVIVAQTREAKV